MQKAYEEAIEQRLGGFLPICSWGAGWILRLQGRIQSALARDVEAIALCREVDWGGHLPDALAEAAHAAALLGDHEAADGYVGEAQIVVGARDHDLWLGMAQAWTAAARGELSRAVAFGQEDRLRLRGEGPVDLRSHGPPRRRPSG